MPAGYCVRIEVWVGVYQETLNAVLCHVCLTLAVFKNSVISHTDNSLCDQASVRVQKQNNIFYVYTKQYDTVSYYVFYEIRPCLLRIISGVMRFNQIKPRFSNQSHWCVVFRDRKSIEVAIKKWHPIAKSSSKTWKVTKKCVVTMSRAKLSMRTRSVLL